MGMTPAEFWEMPPYLFARKVDGYFARENRAGYFFRESYALLYNINRGEKNPAIDGKDVIQLPGEKPKPKPRKLRTKFDPEEIARIACLYNDQGWPPPWKPSDREFTNDELMLIQASKWKELPIWQAWNEAQQAEQLAAGNELNPPA